jgi:hypothetical protein
MGNPHWGKLRKLFMPFGYIIQKIIYSDGYQVTVSGKRVNHSSEELIQRFWKNHQKFLLFK